MKIKTTLAALMVISMASGGYAFAQGRGNQNDRDRNDRNHNEQAQNQPDRNQGRGPGHQGNYSHDERGAGPNHSFHRGERLPREYRGTHYVVDDWRAYHLSAPPRGYHWVQTGGDYVLVAIATGIIAQLLLNN